jgi:phosphate/sulfate permease
MNWYCVHLAAGAIIGAGMLVPIEKPAVGAISGAVLTWFITLAFSAIFLSHH